MHRLRRRFLLPTNVDVLAFHEAFSDLVALFQRFAYRDLVREQLRAVGGRVQLAGALVELAQQVGMAIGTGKAMRSGIGAAKPAAYQDTFEAHDQGAILVAAVFGGFLRVAEQRADALFRIAAGRDPESNSARLSDDLFNRIAGETALVETAVLRMCFRAFDYLPPVDVTFGDFLRALVTADFELNPSDPDELRFAMIEAFRERGIYPAGVISLAEEALILPSGAGLRPLPPDLAGLARELLARTASALDWTGRVRTRGTGAKGTRGGSVLDRYARMVSPPSAAGKSSKPPATLQAQIAQSLHAYALNNARRLKLSGSGTISVAGFAPVFRVGADQKLVVEIVVQFVRTLPPVGDMPVHGGTTVVFDADGMPRYFIHKAASTEKAAKEWMTQLELLDPRTPWSTKQYRKERLARLSSLRRLHGG